MAFLLGRLLTGCRARGLFGELSHISHMLLSQSNQLVFLDSCLYFSN